MADSDSISVDFNPDDMTFGDMIDFEDVAGIPITALEKDQAISSRVLLAMVWIGARRDNPAFTIDEARALKVDQVNFTDPTQPEKTGELQPLKLAKQRAKAS